MEDADQRRNEAKPPETRKGIVVPLEDVVASMVFIIAIATAIVLLRRMLGLSFWASCLLGIPTGFFGSLGLVWLLDRFSRGKR